MLEKRCAIAIVGPTAAGKTTVALAIAKNIPSEIISVDSGKIYNSMNIGTAKPNAEELNRVPHHLINILDPTEFYSAMKFRQDTLKLINEIHIRGKLPLLVGGTMLYFKALQENLVNLPATDPVTRAKLNQEMQCLGTRAMYMRLASLDAQTATRINQNDSQRIQRALEIISITGKPISASLIQQKPITLPFNLIKMSLEPTIRETLYADITKRFDLMLKNKNFLYEVYCLRSRTDMHLNLPSMRCVGYRQIWQYFDGKYSYTEMRAKSIVATRQLAKHQLTWLKNMFKQIIIDCNAINVTHIALSKLNMFLKKIHYDF